MIQHYSDGGSITGLLDLVRGLDHTRFRPVVSFRAANPFEDELRRAGAEVVVLGGAPTTDAPSAGTSPAGAVAPPPRPAARWGARLARSTTRRELSRLIRRDVPHALHLRQVVRDHDVALIHANNDVLSNRDAVIAAVLARVPVVVHVRWIHHYRRDASLAIDKVLARRVSAFLAMSQAIAEGCRPLGIPTSRITVLDDPFDPSDYVVSPPPELGRVLGVPEGARVVVHIGRIVAWKGQDVFLRAMAEVVARHPSAFALVVGGAGDGPDDGFGSRLEAIVGELGITDRVAFTGPRRDVPEILALSEVVVHSSTDPEPFGRVVVEGMAAARAVVGADDGGVPEIIDAGVTGLLVGPRDPVALSEAIDGLLADPEATRLMGQRARRSVVARFSLAGHAREVERTYTRALSRRGRRTLRS
ncbi:hypothetical protein BH24ACT4_BH24ACT4_21700 [soil metagenome]